jgi:hypothetical protein
VARPITPEAARRVTAVWRAAAGDRPAIGATVRALREAWSHRDHWAGDLSIHVV